METVPYGTSLAKLGRFLAAGSGGRSSAEPSATGDPANDRGAWLVVATCGGTGPFDS